MAQVINEPSLGALLGQSLGAGLSQGLGGLAQLKLQQMLQRQEKAREAKGLESLGFSPQEAAGLGNLPLQIQKAVIANLGRGGEAAGLEQALGGISGAAPTQPISEFQATPSGISALTQMQPQVPDQLQGLPPQMQQAQMENLQNIAQTSGLASLAGQAPQEAQVEAPTVQRARQDLKTVLSRPNLSPQQRLKIAELNQKQRHFESKEAAKEQQEINKETLPTYKTVNDEYKAAQSNTMRLERMQELLNRGNLSFPLTASLVKTIGKGIFGLGLDVSAMLTPDSQEFDKLSNDFLKDVKKTFGARITQFEVEAFLKTVPTLIQSDAGKQRVINNLKAFNDASKLRKIAMDKIVEENNGRRPAGLETKIDKRVEPYLDQIASKFKTSYGEEKVQYKPRSAEEVILGGKSL